MLKNLSFFKQKLSEIEKSLADNATISDPEKYRETAKEHARISQIVSVGTNLEKIVSDLDSARNILNSQTEDEELVSIAKEEIVDLEEQKALIEKEYKIPEPVEPNIYKMEMEERERRGLSPLPGNLFEAIEHTKKSALVRETLGEHIFTRFILNKEKEWEEYRIQITSHEIKKYLPFL